MEEKDFCFFHHVAITLLERVQYRASIETFLIALLVAPYNNNNNSKNNHLPDHNHSSDPVGIEYHLPPPNHPVTQDNDDDVAITKLIVKQMKQKTWKQFIQSYNPTTTANYPEDVSLDPLIVLNVPDVGNGTADQEQQDNNINDEYMSVLLQKEKWLYQTDFMMRPTSSFTTLLSFVVDDGSSNNKNNNSNNMPCFK
jgi:hypothetical protein